MKLSAAVSNGSRVMAVSIQSGLKLCNLLPDITINFDTTLRMIQNPSGGALVVVRQMGKSVSVYSGEMDNVYPELKFDIVTVGNFF